MVSITISKNVTKIGKGVFDNCELLKKITVDPENKYFDSRDNCNAIVEKSTDSIVAVAVLFAVFVLINGRAKLSEGFSGKLVQRWSVGDVVLHWCVAVPCIILILSGFGS